MLAQQTMPSPPSTDKPAPPQKVLAECKIRFSGGWSCMFPVGGSQPNTRAGRFVTGSLNPGAGTLSLDSAREALFLFVCLFLFFFLAVRAGTKSIIRDIACNKREKQFIFNIYFHFSIWLHWVLVVACGVLDHHCSMFPDQRLKPGPLHWELGDLATDR